MEIQRKQIKANAKAAIAAKYWPIIGITLLAYVIIIGLSCLSAIPIVGIAVSVFLIPAITIGAMQFSLLAYSGKDPEVSDLFGPFSKEKFLHVVGGYWYMSLFIFLWSLLLVIPGIVKSIAYSMAPYILMNEPEVSATEALERSKQMTNGHKWEIFVFYLSFIGWSLLSVITCGIVGIFYAFPYMELSFAGIYDFLRYEEQKSNADFTATEETAQTEEASESADSESVISEIEASVEGNADIFEDEAEELSKKYDEEDK